MGLSREAQEFNARQKRSNEYYDTAGRGLGRIEEELKTLNRTVDRHLAAIESQLRELNRLLTRLVAGVEAKNESTQRQGEGK